MVFGKIASTVAKKAVKKKRKTPSKRGKANTEDFMNIEFDLKARGKTPAEREKLAKEMGFDKKTQKAVRTKKARHSLPKPPAKPKPKSKSKPTPKRQVKGAKMVQGAGDKSDPGVGKFGAGQKQARGGATKQAKEAMGDTEKDRLARGKAAAGSFKRAQGLKKGSIKQLEDAYDKLTADAKRAQRLKGTKSKYYPVFKKRGMKPMKKGGPLNSTRPKERPVDGIKTAALPSWMKGLSQSEIDSILGRPSRDSGGVKRSEKKKKKKKKTVTARTGGQVISKKNGGKVNMGYGDSLVRQGYDNN